MANNNSWLMVVNTLCFPKYLGICWFINMFVGGDGETTNEFGLVGDWLMVPRKGWRQETWEFVVITTVSERFSHPTQWLMVSRSGSPRDSTLVTKLGQNDTKSYESFCSAISSRIHYTINVCSNLCVSFLGGQNCQCLLFFMYLRILLWAEVSCNADKRRVRNTWKFGPWVCTVVYRHQCVLLWSCLGLALPPALGGWW